MARSRINAAVRRLTERQSQRRLVTDLEFWAFLAVAIPGFCLPMIIAWWKGRSIVPIALLSLVFWPSALILALRLRRRQDQ